MNWRWRLGELYWIVIYVHITFLLLVGWVALGHFLRGHDSAVMRGDVLVVANANDRSSRQS